MAGTTDAGLTDSSQYSDLALILAGVTAGERLRQAAAYRDAAELMMLRQVRDLRAAHWGWEDIGRELGMTRQGAQQFAKRNAGRL